MHPCSLSKLKNKKISAKIAEGELFYSMLTFQATNDFIQEQDWQEDHFLILTSESCNQYFHASARKNCYFL
jgi:hypothetical protein